MAIVVRGVLSLPVGGMRGAVTARRPHPRGSRLYAAKRRAGGRVDLLDQPAGRGEGYALRAGAVRCGTLAVGLLERPVVSGKPLRKVV